MSGRLYAFFGNEDNLISSDDVEQIAQALQQADIDHQIFRYDGAGHGFFCDRRESYRPEIAEDAWEKVKALFSEKL
ncbi:MAG: dienelactone hydrolase family protein [Cyanobacteria bacterium J06627_15]